ncbi:MAG: hypothetical protein P1Q69_06945 [Candidatus Thorarchaeota archaeon]|nr:hypothetical protein [Candidatus Thorarchaeota archaeon]
MLTEEEQAIAGVVGDRNLHGDGLVECIMICLALIFGFIWIYGVWLAVRWYG